LIFSSELLGRLHYIIDDAFGDMIDKEIEHSMLSNTSVKKRKQQINKKKRMFLDSIQMTTPKNALENVSDEKYVI